MRTAINLQSGDDVLDPYVYPNGTLKNKLGIEDYAVLNAKEKELLASKFARPEVVSSNKLDVELLLKIHEYLFEDLFSWAGQYRTVALYKEERFFIPGNSLTYTAPQNIEKELKRAINHLNAVRWNNLDYDSCIVELATRIAKIWKILPFRDGNTRTILCFAKIYALEHGFSMSMDTFTTLLSRHYAKDGTVTCISVRDALVGASVDEAPQPEFLIGMFKNAMKTEIF